MEPAVSVVIGTLGRAEKLAATLAALDRLHRATPPFEAIIVLDGANAEARAVALRPRAFELSLFEQPRSGVGPAKNLGAARARAPYVVFFNDDTRPAAGCLIAHLEAQARCGPTMVLGRVDWDPEREITPYMRWLAPAGHQFNYSRLRPHEPAGWDACWGAHLGIPRDWILDEPFDPVFPYPSLEDSEWGFRQARKGHLPRYVPEAVCYHDHRYDGPADYRQRARISGAAARYTANRHPSLIWSLILRPATAALASSLATLWPTQWRRAHLWNLGFRWNYLLGILTPQRKARLPNKR